MNFQAIKKKGAVLTNHSPGRIRTIKLAANLQRPSISWGNAGQFVSLRIYSAQIIAKQSAFNY